MKTATLTFAAALLLSAAALSTTAMAAEPGKPMSSDPHGTPMPADQAGDDAGMMADDPMTDDPTTDDPNRVGDEGSTVGAKDAGKVGSSDPHPGN
jgi:hypothetical protein